MKLSCQVEYINVGLALIENRSISDVIENNKSSTNIANISVFFTIGGIIFMSVLLGSNVLMTILTIHFRKRNSTDWI